MGPNGVHIKEIPLLHKHQKCSLQYTKFVLTYILCSNHISKYKKLLHKSGRMLILMLLHMYFSIWFAQLKLLEMFTLLIVQQEQQLVLGHTLELPVLSVSCTLPANLKVCLVLLSCAINLKRGINLYQEVRQYFILKDRSGLRWPSIYIYRRIIFQGDFLFMGST